MLQLYNPRLRVLHETFKNWWRLTKVSLCSQRSRTCFTHTDGCHSFHYAHKVLSGEVREIEPRWPNPCRNNRCKGYNSKKEGEPEYEYATHPNTADLHSASTHWRCERRPSSAWTTSIFSTFPQVIIRCGSWCTHWKQQRGYWQHYFKLPPALCNCERHYWRRKRI